MNRGIWDILVNSYENNPRDVITRPQNRQGIWFYVYVENKCIFIESARDHTNSSAIKGRRRLEYDKADVMLALYYDRKTGKPVGKEAAAITHNQVYWYGIFSDLQL